jgi:hypothetical protein
VRDDILDCIDDEDTIDDLRDEANGNGAELLINLKARRDRIRTHGSNNFGLDIEAKYLAHIAAGYADATVAHFNKFKSEATRIRKQLVDTDYVVSDGAFAMNLATATRSLGPFVALKLDQHIMGTNARGHLGRTKTAIITALGEIETDERASQRMHGKSHLGWDPNRNDRSNDRDRRGRELGARNDERRRASSAGPRLNPAPWRRMPVLAPLARALAAVCEAWDRLRWESVPQTPTLSASFSSVSPRVSSYGSTNMAISHVPANTGYGRGGRARPISAAK